MKTSKIIALIFLITTLSLIYVYQQIHIVELSYEKQKKLKLCRQLLDHNTFLRYNLISLESSVNLTKNLKVFELNYEMPAFTQIVDLRSSADRNKLELVLARQQKTPLNNKEKKKENILLSLFSLKSQAEAQTK